MRILAIVLCWWVGVANAAEMRVQTIEGQRYLVVKGSIDQGDDQRLRRTIEGSGGEFDAVTLDSPGGRLIAGMALGRAIRQSKLATHVHGSHVCASACTFVLAGGVVRTAAPSARVGVHLATMSRSDEYISALRSALLNRDLTLDDRIRVVVEVNEELATRASFEQARYLQEMGISLNLLIPISKTEANKMHWLTRRELVEVNLINSD